MVPKPGDVLIRRWSGHRFELLDAVAHERLGIARTETSIMALAATYRGAVWQQDIGSDDQPAGPPVCILPAAS